MNLPASSFAAVTTDYARLRRRLDVEAKLPKEKRLTEREVQVLERIWDRKTNQEIASELGIGKRSVETHRMRLLAKLGEHNVAGMLRAALELGYLDLTAPVRSSPTPNGNELSQ